MKKYFFTGLVVCLLSFGTAAQASDSLFRDADSFVTAKAIKLGREARGLSGARSILDNNGGTSGVEEVKEIDCDPNCASCNKSNGTCSKCTSGRYLNNNMCLVCPGNASCNGTATYSCQSMYRKSSGQCVSNCSGVSCKSGATAKASASGCCCEITSCPSGQRLSGSSCVSNCSGVTCKSGYTAKSTSTGCCCEADTTSCATGKVYNTTIKKCVDAVCPIGCQDSCVNGCGSCASGRYLNYTTGYCPLCSDAMTGCSTCTSGSVCTSCQSGYKLSSGKCVKNTCPSGSLMDSNGDCMTCPINAVCTGTTTYTCATGYTRSGASCIKKIDTPISTGSCNGVSSIPTVCPSGTTRTSRGCCPAGATASQACLQCAIR